MITGIASRSFRLLKEAFFNKEYGYKTTHFWGPVFNWGIVGAAVYDASKQGPEIISIPVTLTMLGYSSVFMRFAWMVKPRNYLLYACHAFNLLAQLVQLQRGVRYQLTPPKLTGDATVDEPAMQAFNKRKHDLT
uniref:Mitochondrial pyruvate carrier n=2 Tax=Lygus hesperus TaxID=30085 RepID=A0A0A9X5N6_LYGHE